MTLLSRHRRRRLAVALILPFCLPAQAHALSFDAGDGVRIRWNTTLDATFAFRLDGPQLGLLINGNGNDGDLAFATGSISQRLDGFSELDISRGDGGLSVSGDGWHDPVYHQHTATASAYAFNPLSVRYDQFPKATTRQEGADGELLEAYIHDKFMLAGLPLTMRIGRQTLLWGESQFFPENGIAAGQAPYDYAHAFADPIASAKQLYLPVAQAVAILKLCRDIGVQAYVQGEWRPDRLPAVDSYYSTSDFLDAGGERLFADNSYYDYYRRAADHTPAGRPQFGMALRITEDVADVGLYALRFNAKAPQLYLQPYGVPIGQEVGRYGLIYPAGIDIYGISFSTFAGDDTLAGEISWRRHMPLVSSYPQAGRAPAYYADQPYAAGDTLHAQLSLQATVPPVAFWPGANVTAEFAANDRLAVTRDRALLVAGRDRFATEFRILYTAQLFQVLPQLDVVLPFSAGYDLTGNSSIFAGQNAHSGDLEVGVALTWRVAWQAAIRYVHYLGSPAHQSLADRNVATISFSRSF